MNASAVAWLRLTPSSPMYGPLAGLVRCCHSGLKKKNARFLTIGPPIENPYYFCSDYVM